MGLRPLDCALPARPPTTPMASATAVRQARHRPGRSLRRWSSRWCSSSLARGVGSRARRESRAVECLDVVYRFLDQLFVGRRPEEAPLSMCIVVAKLNQLLVTLLERLEPGKGFVERDLRHGRLLSFYSAARDRRSSTHFQAVSLDPLSARRRDLRRVRATAANH